MMEFDTPDIATAVGLPPDMSLGKLVNQAALELAKERYAAGYRQCLQDIGQHLGSMPVPFEEETRKITPDSLIEDLGFKPHIVRLLKRYGCTDLQTLTLISRETYGKFKRFSSNAIDAVAEKLQDNGFTMPVNTQNRKTEETDFGPKLTEKVRGLMFCGSEDFGPDHFKVEYVIELILMYNAGTLAKQPGYHGLVTFTDEEAGQIAQRARELLGLPSDSTQ